MSFHQKPWLTTVHMVTTTMHYSPSIIPTQQSVSKSTGQQGV